MNKRVGAALLALWMLLGAAPALGAAQRLEQTHQAGKVEVIFDAVVAPPLVENAQPLRVRYKQWTDQEIARFWLKEEAPPKGPDVDYTGPDGKSLLGLGGEASIYVSHWIDIEYTLAMCNLSANADHTQGQLEHFSPDDAWAQVEALCRDVGLEPMLVDYTAMDTARLQAEDQRRQEEQRALFEPYGLWTPREETPQPPAEGYFFEVMFAYDGLICNQVPTSINSFSDYSLGSSGLFYVVPEHGVIWFETGVNATLYEILERTSPENYKESMPMEQALDSLYGYYERLILNQPVTIVYIGYEYLAVPTKTYGEFVLRPVWSFYPDMSGDEYLEPVYVNAINGRVL